MWKTAPPRMPLTTAGGVEGDNLQTKLKWTIDQMITSLRSASAAANPIDWLSAKEPGFRALPDQDRKAIMHFALRGH